MQFHSKQLLYFSTPGFVAAYVIRSPEQVEASTDNLELTALALYGPVLCALSLFGLYFAREEKKPASTATAVSEVTPLVAKQSMARRKSSVAGLNQAFRRSNVVSRRSSVEVMGGLSGGFDTLAEREIQQNQLKDLEEFKRLMEMDLDEEE